MAKPYNTFRFNHYLPWSGHWFVTVPICSDRLFDKIADLRIVSDSLGFSDIGRLNSEPFIHLTVALATYKQFADQEQLCFLEHFPDAADQPTSLVNALRINPVSGNRTLLIRPGVGSGLG